MATPLSFWSLLPDWLTAVLTGAAPPPEPIKPEPPKPKTMEILIKEIGTAPNSTASQMFINGKAFCFVIEDGYREVKVRGETRIPPGRYRVSKIYAGKFYEKYKAEFGHKFAIGLEDVPQFSLIRIHIGNKPINTDGCPLVNRCIGINPTTGEYDGTDSTTVYKLFYKLVEAAFDRGEDVWCDVLRN